MRTWTNLWKFWSPPEWWGGQTADKIIENHKEFMKLLFKEHKMSDGFKIENWENCPGHAHSFVGIWDSDNGLKANTVCEACRRWNEYPKLKSIIDSGQRVKGDGDLFCVGKVYDGIEPTHTALLIDVREIQRDTPELLLREYVKTRNSSCWTGTEFDSWLERVRKVLK